ncbi:MAG: Hsp70 family protein [Bacteroidales bacterium]
MKEKLIKYVYSKFKSENGVDLPEDELTSKRINDACSRALEELNSHQEAEINLPFIMADSSGPKHINIKVTREIISNLENGYDDTFDKKSVIHSPKNFSSTNIDDILNNSSENNNPAANNYKSFLWVIIGLAIVIAALAFYFLNFKN